MSLNSKKIRISAGDFLFRSFEKALQGKDKNVLSPLCTMILVHTFVQLVLLFNVVQCVALWSSSHWRGHLAKERNFVENRHSPTGSEPLYEDRSFQSLREIPYSQSRNRYEQHPQINTIHEDTSRSQSHGYRHSESHSYNSHHTGSDEPHATLSRSKGNHHSPRKRGERETVSKRHPHRRPALVLDAHASLTSPLSSINSPGSNKPLLNISLRRRPIVNTQVDETDAKRVPFKDEDPLLNYRHLSCTSDASCSKKVDDVKNNLLEQLRGTLEEYRFPKSDANPVNNPSEVKASKESRMFTRSLSEDFRLLSEASLRTSPISGNPSLPTIGALTCRVRHISLISHNRNLRRRHAIRLEEGISLPEFESRKDEATTVNDRVSLKKTGLGTRK